MFPWYENYVKKEWWWFGKQRVLCFLDRKIMLLRNGEDSVNNSSCGHVVYRITTIPSWHNFHIKETVRYSLFTTHNAKVGKWTTFGQISIQSELPEVHYELHPTVLAAVCKFQATISCWVYWPLWDAPYKDYQIVRSRKVCMPWIVS